MFSEYCYSKLPELCFIFPRHVKNSIHKDIWKECLKCIRTNYKNELVIIIDDNSHQNLIEDIDNENIWMMQNVTIIQSEFIGSGEMLPFYYFHKLKPAKKAVFLNDSMFIQKPFDKELIDNIEDIKFLWHFDNYCLPNFSNYNMVFNDIQSNLLQQLNYGNELSAFFFSNKWVGCFASTCIINLKFLELLEFKYNFTKLVYHINNRDLRQVLERTVAIIIFYELQNKSHIINNISIFGNIVTDYPYSFNYSFDNYKTNKLNIPLIKCWNSR